MTIRREEIEEAVRDIVVGSGDNDIEYTLLLTRVETRLGYNLTQDQREIVKKTQLRCYLEVEFP